MNLDFFLDPSCVFCGQDPGELAYLCSDCLEDLPFAPQVIHKKNQDFMGAFLYTGKMKDLLTRYKFEDKRYLKTTLAQLFAKALMEGFPGLSVEGFVVIPSSPGRKKKRGFDPMDLIGQDLERVYGLSYKKNILKKHKENPLQIQLSTGQREENVQGVFSACPLKGENLLVLDDILTTGSTLAEARKTLLEAGAGKVYGLSLSY